MCNLQTGHFKNGLLQRTGLPDGIFSNQKSQFGKILEGLAMEDVGIFNDHLVQFTVIWYILWPFGRFMVIWHIFSCFGMLHQKSGNPGREPLSHHVNPQSEHVLG
jgi:hypothetical protein